MRMNYCTVSLLACLSLCVASCSAHDDKQIHQGARGKSGDEKVDASAPITSDNEHAAPGPVAQMTGTGQPEEVKPEIYDFKKYKQIFHKHYGSLVEELSRSKLFMMRALKVASSYLRYKAGFADSYMSLNRMSDWTKEERDWLKPHTDKSSSSLPPPIVADALNEEPRASGAEHLRTKRGAVDLERGKASGLMPKLFKKAKNALSTAKCSSSSCVDRAAFGSNIDLRSTKCFTKPMHQGGCGSCYALAGIALYEYLYCRAHKTLVQFSAQYIVDCGHITGALGCNGGNFEHVAKFANVMGFELGSEYPYTGSSASACRHSGPNEDGSSPGFIRAASDALINGGMGDWEYWLRKEVPLYVVIGYGEKFLDYGGGVDDPNDCDDDEGHAVVLVGMGTENGKNYWLMRNSLGVDWGLGGYYKLNKKSRCIMRNGAAFAPHALKRVSKGAFTGSRGSKLSSGSNDPGIEVNIEYDFPKTIEEENKKEEEGEEEWTEPPASPPSPTPPSKPSPPSPQVVPAYPASPKPNPHSPPAPSRPSYEAPVEDYYQTYYKGYGEYGAEPYRPQYDNYDNHGYNSYDSYGYQEEPKQNPGEWHYDNNYGCMVRTVQESWSGW